MTPSLGDCPKCGELIPTGLKIIEYEKKDETTGVYAECPECDKVVNPQ